jgi:hypothetical protein
MVADVGILDADAGGGSPSWPNDLEATEVERDVIGIDTDAVLSTTPVRLPVT